MSKISDEAPERRVIENQTIDHDRPVHLPFSAAILRFVLHSLPQKRTANCGRPKSRYAVARCTGRNFWKAREGPAVEKGNRHQDHGFVYGDGSYRQMRNGCCDIAAWPTR
jgi:hypothetical protein